MDNRNTQIINAKAPFELPPLPYGHDALEPFISQKTISFHYEKHHRKYVVTTNELIQGTELRNLNLEQIIKATAGKPDHQKIFNNAAQAWNHWFYWNCMNTQKAKMPSGKILKAIDSSFSGFDRFGKEFTDAALTQFGSGYAWLVRDGEKLKVIKTANADTPIAHGLKPILAIDVWEHAYYLDYQNKREDYVSAFIGNLIDWEFAEENWEKD